MTKKFYELTPDERLALLVIDDDIRTALSEQQSTVNAQLVENYISDFRVPMGVIRDLLINQQHYQVPMATEEPSVIAAANNGAKMLSAGIDVQIGRTAMIGQMMFVTEKSLADFVQAHRLEIFDIARQARPSIYQRGGGLLDVVVRQVSENETSVDFIIDTKDAMGANIVDTILEAELPLFESFNPLGVILSNYATQQLVTATADIAFERVGGEHVARQIVALNHFAQSDPYRATTENKGLFNGVSAVVLATGNDWRAVEASGHAYASRNGQYQALTTWSIKDNQLHGELTMPISVGTVGGAISVLPAAQNGLAILGHVNADELRMVIVSVGLAQNLAALKAIVSGGIQQGHMRMQYRALAMQVGAEVSEVKRLVPRLMAEKHVDTELATKILMEIRNESKS
ncbi:hydroxymethylglutaryl-CoA reductase, degradative [Leuconostoc falkenbergense]|uniref:hydroxymethylglutaryl-CoA reductase, degradative n=1 Tax=Leuconostoc falkenbergense TaxID=2766470 RepID=UPI0021AA173F|nr:hydroxymethylglutaryl-CoA reductase, degradative [Leuconostoc falkenbergense]MCT4378052.1 hydroxymethylglutaryl-CoA reductase, degradative [Leuconostoc falkenbergense]MDV8952065.1 hydroxymethylglutaryl-CoA reductase, degradative [Leuconostoc falkenbergense]